MKILWRGEGQVNVVAIPGMPQPPTAVEPFLADLDGVRVGQVQLPGYGDTGSTPSKYDFDTVATELADMIGSERPTVLVGISAGSYRALQVALAGTVELLGLVLVSPVAGLSTDDERAALRGLAALLRSQADMTDILRSRWLTEAEAATPEAATVLDWQHATSRGDLARECEGFAQAPYLLPRLRDVSVPVTILTGEHDVAVPLASARKIESALPDCALHVVRDVGHALGVFAAHRSAAVVADAVGAMLGGRRMLVGDQHT